MGHADGLQHLAADRLLPLSFRFVVVALAFVACAPRSEPPPVPSRGPSVVESAVLRAALDVERERWSRERRERQLDAVDPGELIEHSRRHHQLQIDAREVDVAKIFQQGETLFERRFTPPEGLGFGRAVDRGLTRVEGPAMGPDAMSCVECHHRGGDDGAGEQHQRAWLGGDGRRLSTAQPRVAPHLAGLGLVQLLAAEMTRDLQQRREQVVSQPGDSTRFELVSKGVSFGTLMVRDGGLDLSEVVGVDADLVVRPFGWKGAHATLRTFVRAALPQHMGLEPLPLPADGGAFADIESKPWLHDEDQDQVAGELHEGQLTSMAVYLALLDVPQVRPPVAADLREAWGRGAVVFGELGCAECHRPTLPLQGHAWVERGEGRDAGLAIDLIADVQVPPALEQRDYARPLEVALFSDLRRHDLGPELATAAVDGGVAPRLFLTRPLWGLGTRGNAYLHDGRARTIADAVLAHGGEAAGVREKWKAASEGDRAAVGIYLLSLRRQPMARLQP